MDYNCVILAMTERTIDIWKETDGCQAINIVLWTAMKNDNIKCEEDYAMCEDVESRYSGSGQYSILFNY